MFVYNVALKLVFFRFRFRLFPSFRFTRIICFLQNNNSSIPTLQLVSLWRHVVAYFVTDLRKRFWWHQLQRLFNLILKPETDFAVHDDDIQTDSCFERAGTCESSGMLGSTCTASARASEKALLVTLMSTLRPRLPSCSDVCVEKRDYKNNKNNQWRAATSQIRMLIGQSIYKHLAIRASSSPQTCA